MGKISETNSVDQGVLFDLSPVKGKPVTLSFTGNDISSDGGLLLLRECEQRVGIIDAIGACIKDDRHSSYIKHSYKELLTQRVLQIAAGYEDADDCDSLRSDDILKICSGVLPSQGHLSSQPTMSRFEQTPTRGDLYRIAEAFVNNFIKSYIEQPKVIVLDCDDTNSNTYGAQQLSLFNDYYGEYCYMPLHIYEGLSGKLVTTILKPGRRSKNLNVFAILSRLIERLHSHWPDTLIIVRGDSHFCSHQLMDWCKEREHVHFVTGITSNSTLQKLSEITVATAQKQHKHAGRPVKLYHSFEYKAGSWANSQRVIVKVEVSDLGSNVRYIVTDLRQAHTRSLYEDVYCARGAMELRIKEHKTYLRSNRMSCSKFSANQFRLFLHSAAYVLLHNLQTQTLHATQYAKATFKTIREKVIKVAAYVREIKTRIKIELPASCPQISELSRCLALFKALRT